MDESAPFFSCHPAVVRVRLWQLNCIIMKDFDFDHSFGRSPTQTAQSQCPLRRGAPLTQLFATAPPERRGLHGEYDYFGLLNRVLHTFEQRFGRGKLDSIRLTQRGAIVVMEAKSCDLYLLYELIAIALRTDGTEGVELNGTTVFDLSALHRLSVAPSDNL